MMRALGGALALCAVLLGGRAGAEPAASPAASPAATPTAEQALQACREGLAGPTIERQHAMCFYDVAARLGHWEPARAELEARVAEPGSAPILRLPLALLVAHHGELSRAVTLLGEALAGMPDAPPAARALVRINRGQYLMLQGRYVEARADYEAVAALGRAHGLEELELAGQLELGTALMRQGSDLSRVRALYDDVVPRALARGSYEMGTKALVARGMLWMRLGKAPERRRDYEMMLERARAKGDVYNEMFARTELLSMDLDALDPRDGAEIPTGLKVQIDAVRRQAEAANQPATVAFLLVMEGDVLAGAGRAAEAAATYERAAEVQRQAESLHGQLQSQSWQALQLSLAGEHERARAIVREADERARAAGLRETWLHTGFVLTATAMLAGDVGPSLAHADRHFDEIELYREIQGDTADRSHGLSGLSFAYYFVSGTLLGRPDRSPDQLDAAFAAIERMRARNLLDGLRRSDALRRDPEDPDEQAWQQTVDQIARVQRALLVPGLDEAARHAELARLERLEAAERRQRTALAEGTGALGSLLVPELARITDVQAALGEHEAILSYQLADHRDRLGGPEGGSWLWVITHDAVQVHPLPERYRLERRLAFVSGLFARRDGSERDAMARLHHELMAPALDSLSPQIDRLVIVPDGMLWSLPFAALRSDPEAPPLVARYSLSLVPSVTSWMRWGDRAPEVAPGLLALAQPQLQVGAQPADFRQGTLASGLELGALPRAREEVEAIVRIWEAGPSSAEVGERASERFLKDSDLSHYGLVHFATHAVMEPRYPDRSAVVLAAGGDDEDGLLQAREIVRLPLHGKVVVLSACSGAAGAFVRGEGVMSLARAFLQGGAQAVVASRWPLADADAVALFERFYLHLDEGLPLSGALAAAQRDLIEAGAPAAAWAGVVVLGRGDQVLVPRPWWWPWRRAGLVAAALLVLLAAAAMARRARRRRSVS